VSLGTLIYDYYPWPKSDEYATLFSDLIESKTLIGGNDQCRTSIVDALIERGSFSEMEKEMYAKGLHLDGTNVYPRFHYWDEQLRLNPNDKEIQKIVMRNDEAIAFAPTFVKNRKFYQKELSKWHSLFAIPSLDECNMLWNDSGILAFCINEDDLLKKDFSKIYVTIESA
jgi:uncharacterized protein YwqG